MLPGFEGEILQKPPAYSALKIDGRRAYDLARAHSQGRGEAPDLAPRPIRIDRLALVDMPDADHAVFEVDCGKGAYVRALARDFGAARSEERRVGKEGVSTCSSRWSPFHYKKKELKTISRNKTRKNT